MSVLERVREHEDTGARASESRHLAAEHRSRLKHDLVQRLGLSAVAALAANEDVAAARSEIEVACQAILNTGDYGSLDPADRELLVSQVLDEVCGLGPLQPLLEDPTITEIMVNGCERLFYERDGELHPAQRVFDSADQIMLVVDRILAPLGRRLDKSSPIVNARLANGDRLNAVAPPIAVDGPAVTIRKFSNRIVSMEQLVELGAVPQWYATLLGWAVRSRCDIAVAGGTGSGKTTLLNALSCEIDKRERIVTIEDSAELRFDSHPNVVRLEARDASIEGTGEVTIRDLVKNALRMRPDRIVVGEVRGEEAIDMISAMNTGHDGSLTTCHAGTADEVVLRLVLMARFGMDLPTDIIEEQIASALDLIVMSRRMADGSRFLSSLSEVSRADGGGVQLAECVRFDEVERTWNLVREPAFVSHAVAEGIVRGEEVQEWRRCVA
ncbi:MAG: CpaF family protein [Coriobacteriales bacterium]|nr:CpaF family protein [Coriobacteriales bacterium]